jgi:hypothetical protein
VPWLVRWRHYDLEHTPYLPHALPDEVQV